MIHYIKIRNKLAHYVTDTIMTLSFQTDGSGQKV